MFLQRQCIYCPSQLKFMENTNLVNYLQWADTKIFDLLQIHSKNDEEDHRIKSKLLHLTEEYRAWLHDIQKLDIRSFVEVYNTMTVDQLIDEIKVLHKLWMEYVTNHVADEIYDIDEGSFSVPIKLDQVVFNLVNHSSYHRGQIILLLRLAGIETPITDYYWYKISKL